jgi:RNA-directed DNA polymerase
VNTGAPWPSLDAAVVRVLGMQTKLHRWAGENEDRRFDDLYNLVSDPAFLVVAWSRVKGNRGSRSAGVDGETVRGIEARRGADAFLADLRAELRAGSFRPLPVRERMIPKSGGKLRRLGIPTARDRVVQAALKLVLEPIFEADFEPCSYGFRPRRRAQDAIAEIHYLASPNRNYGWVFEADIEACFDSIDHIALMGRVRRRVGDKRLLALVKAFLKAGLMTETGSREESITGTPQGGILSPLLANIALSALDEHFARKWEALGPEWKRAKHRRQGGACHRLVRYADDFVVMVAGSRGDAETLRDEANTVLAPLGLRLADAKTRVCSIDEGFDFLGWHIQRRRKRGTGQHYIYTYPSKRAILAIRRKVRTLTRRTSQPNLRLLLLRVNAALRGWANYFKHGVSKRSFSTLGHFAWRRVTRWLHQRHLGLNWTTIRRRFMHGWEIVCDGITLYNPSTVAITRYRYRGARIPSPWSPTADTTARPAESRMR